MLSTCDIANTDDLAPASATVGRGVLFKYDRLTLKVKGWLVLFVEHYKKNISVL